MPPPELAYKGISDFGEDIQQTTEQLTNVDRLVAMQQFAESMDIKNKLNNIYSQKGTVDDDDLISVLSSTGNPQHVATAIDMKNLQIQREREKELHPLRKQALEGEIASGKQARDMTETEFTRTLEIRDKTSEAFKLYKTDKNFNNLLAALTEADPKQWGGTLMEKIQSDEDKDTFAKIGTEITELYKDKGSPNIGQILGVLISHKDGHKFASSFTGFVNAQEMMKYRMMTLDERNATALENAKRNYEIRAHKERDIKSPGTVFYSIANEETEMLENLASEYPGGSAKFGKGTTPKEITQMLNDYVVYSKWKEDGGNKNEAVKRFEKYAVKVGLMVESKREVTTKDDDGNEIKEKVTEIKFAPEYAYLEDMLIAGGRVVNSEFNLQFLKDNLNSMSLDDEMLNESGDNQKGGTLGGFLESVDEALDE